MTIQKIINHSLWKLQLFTGIDSSLKFNSPFSFFRLLSEKRQLKKSAGKEIDLFPIKRFSAHYSDKSDTAGSLPYHYFWQDLHVAQRIFENNPQEHYDVGSSVSSFVAHVASFRKIKIFDVRPLQISCENIEFQQLDLMSDDIPKNQIDSISCLHALEHFGLGRYGDPINFWGHKIGFENITKMLKPNGKFYFSVPFGNPQRIEFHAHRVFSLKYLLELIQPAYNIIEFSYINDSNEFFKNIKFEDELEKNFGCKYGCAIFELEKK